MARSNRAAKKKVKKKIRRVMARKKERGVFKAAAGLAVGGTVLALPENLGLQSAEAGAPPPVFFVGDFPIDRRQLDFSRQCVTSKNDEGFSASGQQDDPDSQQYSARHKTVSTQLNRHISGKGFPGATV